MRVLLVLLLVTGVQAAAPTIPEDVQANIRERVERRFNPGIVVGLINADGTATFHAGVSAFTDGRPVDEHSVFEIGSITKTFTAIALARLVERGRLAFDDPLAERMPDNRPVPQLNGRSIRLEHLSTHHSGLPRLPGNAAMADPANPYADYTVELLYAFLGGHELRREPGSAYEYSNLGAGLLGHLLALAEGVSYETLIRRTIAEPLEMHDTAIELSPALQARLAVGHASVVPVPNWDLPALAGAGALRSTVADMLKFLAANMGLRETPLAAALRESHRVRHTVSESTDVALGWHVFKREAGEIVWHNGATGGYNAWAGFRRDGTLGAVVLSNGTQPVGDIGLHLLDPSAELWQPPAKKKRPPLFKKSD